MRVPSGDITRYLYFVAVDPTDLQTRETGLSGFTVYRSRNGGAAAAYTTPTVNETDVTNMPGVYELLIDEDTTIDAGDDEQEYVVHITHASMEPVTRALELYRPKVTEGNTLGVAADGDISGNLDGTVATVTTLTGHTPQTGDSFARLGAPAGASVSADIATVDTVVDGIQTDLDNGTDGLGAIKTDTAAILVDTAEIGAAGAGLTAVPWNASWDAEVQSEVDDALVAAGLDHLVSVAVTGTDVADNSIMAKIVAAGATADWDTYVNTTDSLQATRDHIGDGTNLTEAGGTGDHLTAIDLPNQTMDITGNITGNLSGSVGSVTGAVGSVSGNVDGNVTGSIGSLGATAKTDVNTEVDSAFTTQMADSVPADGTIPTREQAMYMVTQFLLERAVAGTTVTVKKVDGSTTLMTLTLDDGTTPTSITRAT